MKIRYQTHSAEVSYNEPLQRFEVYTTFGYDGISNETGLTDDEKWARCKEIANDPQANTSPMPEDERGFQASA